MQLEFVQVWDLALLPQHCFSDLQAKGFPKGRRHSVADLTVLVPDSPREGEVVSENS